MNIDVIWFICTAIVYLFEFSGIALLVGLLYQAAVKITKMSEKL